MFVNLPYLLGSGILDLNMSQLTRDDVLKLARLARLRLSEDEIVRFQKEMTTILEYFEQLKSIDTGDLAPTNQVTGLKNVWRQDEIKDYGVTPRDLLSNAPALEENLLKVQRVLE